MSGISETGWCCLSRHGDTCPSSIHEAHTQQAQPGMIAVRLCRRQKRKLMHPMLVCAFACNHPLCIVSARHRRECCILWTWL